MINGDYDGAKAKALELSRLFGPEDFYLEIQDHGHPGGETGRPGPHAPRTGRRAYPWPLTNDAHYIKKEDAYYQDVLMCIQMGKTVDEPGRMRFESQELYLKSEEEMRCPLPGAARRLSDNTVDIAAPLQLRF